jgi:predicted RNA-binding Zn-ribbon protein involved in translation (DUF1610 family)
MEENLQRIAQFQCPNCGSADVGYSADAKKLQCTHCKHTWELESSRDKIVERRLGDTFDADALIKGWGIETQLVHCQACGSATSVPNEQVNISCVFCGSTAVNTEAMDSRVIRPSGILPFTYPQKEALKVFQNWISEGVFHPNDITALASLDKINGVYLPFWTYDAFTESSWTAEAGFHYYEDISTTDAEGKIQTRQEQKTNWVAVGGYYEKFFDDVLVIASKGVSQADISAISPFPLEEVVNYDHQYIVGWDCEVYQKDVKEGFATADKIMDVFIQNECGKKIKADTFRNLAVATRKHGLTFKHILLPIWIATYHYNGKGYQFIVNGNSGKIHGEKPFSPWKIALAVTAIIGLIIMAIGIYALVS